MFNRLSNPNTPFEGKVRVRACGILIKDQRILLLKHKSVGSAGYLWSPPGGGVEFGDSLNVTLKREFLEETNLNIDVKEYLFTNEFIDDKHHAIELFFKVEHVSGALKLGTDPELSDEDQILTEMKLFNKEELNEIPENALHNAFHVAQSRDRIDDLRGLLTFRH